MLISLFPLAFTALMMCLLLKAFKMMYKIAATKSSGTIQTKDRTGLQTIHPELLDDNGDITGEELWAVRFSDLEGFATTNS